MVRAKAAGAGEIGVLGGGAGEIGATLPLRVVLPLRATLPIRVALPLGVALPPAHRAKEPCPSTAGMAVGALAATAGCQQTRSCR